MVSNWRDNAQYYYWGVSEPTLAARMLDGFWNNLWVVNLPTGALNHAVYILAGTHDMIPYTSRFSPNPHFPYGFPVDPDH